MAYSRRGPVFSQTLEPLVIQCLASLVKLIRKLRWMGMEADAERVETTLSGLSPADSVLAAPHETD
jgi:hypothetical protein